MSPEVLESVVYNARNRASRDLADWWEEHQAADARREAVEKKKAEHAAALESALKKLTPAEYKALGLIRSK